jgi:hypothetical protein
MLSPSDKEVKDTVSESQTEASEMLQDIQTGKQNTKAFGEAIFISMPAATQQIHLQRLSPENKGTFPYIPLRAGYRNWGLQIVPCMVT